MNVFEKLYKELKRKYGMPKGQWKLWCKRPKIGREREEVIIGAILTQRTNWKNVELALNNLKKAKINSLKSILRLGEKRLAPLIRPSGFYQTKANYLFHLVEFILKNYGNLEKMRKADLKELKEQLLELKGIGPETADSILLYALDKTVFVIDEYTRRIVKKRGLADTLATKLSRSESEGKEEDEVLFAYAFLQKLFEKNLRKDFRLYQDFHALIVINGKNSRSKN
jgi:endonuclease-3 related protein